jgi:acyl dehydratase
MGTVKPGWQGRFFEDFEVGDVYEHPLGRTVLAADNVWFTLLTQNTAQIHFDAHYAAQTEWGRPLVDSTFTLALVTGQSVTDVSQNVMANLGWDNVACPARCSRATRSTRARRCWRRASPPRARTSASCASRPPASSRTARW